MIFLSSFNLYKIKIIFNFIFKFIIHKCIYQYNLNNYFNNKFKIIKSNIINLIKIIF